MMAFDIETHADYSILPFLPEPEAPANYKDAEKIAAYKVTARQKQLQNLALDPATCQIVALGYTRLDGELVVSVCPDESTERDALIRFWDAYNETESAYTYDPTKDLDPHRAEVVGFNCVGFDLPVLLMRSMILRVPRPGIILRKHGSADVRDLMLELSFNGIIDYKSLSFWCRRFHLAVPDDPTSGKDIATLVGSQDWDAVAAHCRIDVEKTLALAEYLNQLNRA